jgi:miniconductance mechanosensitive channel
MMHELYKYLLDLFRDTAWISSYAKPVAACTVIGIIMVLARLAHFATKKVAGYFIRQIVHKTKNEWDDILLKKKVFNGLAHLVPFIIIYSSCFFAAPVLDKPLAEMPPETIRQLSADHYFTLGPVLIKFARIYLIFTFAYILITLLNAGNDIYQLSPYAHHRPIKGYIQLLKILVLFLASIFIISLLIGKDPTVLIAGLGAMTAVLLLVFKDTILGFVASIQLSTNEMVKIGDWVEIPDHKADGTVADITLNTVKIRNWDNTITTVPTYRLISESFINWKGMEESEGRRIKRSVFIDMYSIQFCTPELCKRLEKIDLIREYVIEKEEEIKQYQNNHLNYDPAGGFGSTNLGIFKKYLELYVRNNPKINLKMSTIVRQLQSTDKGVPIEIYAFSKEKEWVGFEAVQDEIFDHVMAVIPEFGLRIFQLPTAISKDNNIK